MKLLLGSTALVLAAAAAAHAHHATPEEVVTQLRGEEVRRAFDITSVERSADLPRMLLVRVGPAWTKVDPAQRVAAAERWYALWRDAVPNGIVAIVDTAEHPLVNFDPGGRAHLRDAGPVPTSARTPHQ